MSPNALLVLLRSVGQLAAVMLGRLWVIRALESLVQTCCSTRNLPAAAIGADFVAITLQGGDPCALTPQGDLFCYEQFSATPPRP